MNETVLTIKLRGRWPKRAPGWGFIAVSRTMLDTSGSGSDWIGLDRYAARRARPPGNAVRAAETAPGGSDLRPSGRGPPGAAGAGEPDCHDPGERVTDRVHARRPGSSADSPSRPGTKKPVIAPRSLVSREFREAAGARRQPTNDSPVEALISACHIDDPIMVPSQARSERLCSQSTTPPRCCRRRP